MSSTSFGAVYASCCAWSRATASTSTPVHGRSAAGGMTDFDAGIDSSPVCTRALNCEMPSAYASSQAFSSLAGSSASHISWATRVSPTMRIVMSSSMSAGLSSPKTSAMRPSAVRRISSSCVVRSRATWYPSTRIASVVEEAKMCTIPCASRTMSTGPLMCAS